MLLFIFFYLALVVLCGSFFLGLCLQQHLFVVLGNSGILFGVTVDSVTLLTFSFAEFPLSLLRLGEMFCEGVCFYAESPFLTSIYETSVSAVSLPFDLSEFLFLASFVGFGECFIRTYSIWRLVSWGPFFGFLICLCCLFVVPCFVITEAWSGALSLVTDDFTFFEESSDRFNLSGLSFLSVFVCSFLFVGFIFSNFPHAFVWVSLKFWRRYFWSGLVIGLFIWELSCLALFLYMCIREVLVLVVLLRKEYIRVL